MSEEAFYFRPLVGEIGARQILLLAAPRKTLTLALYSYVQGKLLETQTALALGPRPSTFVFEVVPNFRYRLEWYADFSVSSAHNKSLCTQYCFTGAPKSLTFVSCDYPLLDTTDPLWQRLQREEDHLSPSTVVHLGDNIYGDKDFHWGVHHLLTTDWERFSLREISPTYQVSLEERIASRYHRTYQETWARWQNLQHFTNHLAFPDDHDITDGANRIGKKITQATDHSENWTSREEAEIFTYQVARNCLQDYQESLLISQQYGPHGWHQIFTSPSGEKTLLYVAHRLDLGEEKYTPQHLEYLRQLLRGVQTAILCFTTAPLPRPPGIYQRVYQTLFGCDGLWTNTEAEEFYTFCSDWLEENPQSRLVVVGGDIHIGVHLEVQRGSVSFPVLVSGPVSNHPSTAEYFYASGLRKLRRLGSFRLEPRWVAAKRNAISLHLDSEEPRIEIHKSRFRWPRRLRNLWRAYQELTGSGEKE